MKDALISEITSFTLAARGRLEQEADEQLQGLYGWLKDGSFVDATRSPATQSLPEAAETRRRLEQFAADEAAAGLAAPDARKKLLRETAFTWLNRLVGFRLLEDRKLIKQTISKLGDSNAFKFWLVEDANAAAYAEYQKGDMPKNATDEGPSEVAYRQFLLSQCAALAVEVSILFDPANLPSRLCPRPAVLKELVESINAADLIDAWKPGNEETLGWLYQAFNAQELQDAFAAARESKKKFEAADIPAVTQLFTIRWVVRFLVENTLGRLWVEMHPDSRLKDQLGYLVPVQKSDRPLKLACEITFLDPCCGSMHFGLLAFDLFVEMYREELERAGQPGWPAQPSVSSIDEIAGSIVANNIHGIDLDTRAVQLSALALFLRARTLNPDCPFTDQNLASANVEEITGGRLEEFIQRAQFSHPIYERILRSLATQLKDSANLGSLLRVEKDLERLISAERQKAEADKQFALAFPGLDVSQFKTQAGLEEFFGILTEQVMRHLDAFVQESRAEGQDRTHFTREAAKGLRFMRLIEQRYDVVTTNPPYLSNRKMNSRLQTLMGEQYSAGKQDLFAAFILRCQELVTPQGLLGMLTMHSYMFISSYEQMREQLRKQVAIETLAHFGGGLFAVGNPGTLQTAAFVLRKEPYAQAREKNRGVYFRLVRERDADAKRSAFEAALAALRARKAHPQVFACQQSDFDAIPGNPWVYWLDETLRNLFAKHPALRDLAPPRQGMATADNKRFLRKWWEVGLNRIGVNLANGNRAKDSGLAWFPYMKGGTAVSWFGNQEHVLNYRADGVEIKAHAAPLYGNSGWSRIIKSTDKYFLRGVTWSDISSKGFAARLSPGGFVHDVSGMTCFPEESAIFEVLAVLNSSVAKHLLAAINPTIHYQVGDIARLPVPRNPPGQLDEKVKAAVELAGWPAKETERTYRFIAPPRALRTVVEHEQQLARLESEIDMEVSRLYGLNDKDLASIRQELAGTPAVTAEADGTEQQASEGETQEDERGSDTWSELTLAQAWISYALGTVLGRYAIGEPTGLGRGDFDGPTVVAIRALIDPDGVMVAEKGHPQDIVRCTVQCLETMRGRDTAHALIRTAAGDSSGDPEDLLRGWLERFTGQPAVSFWKYHHQLYRKRPIYWPLQSPKKHFTAWVFHERFGPTTLFTIKQLADDQCRLIEREITSLRTLAATNRAAAKKLDQLLEATEDIREFSNRLQTIANGGYTFCTDDGVLLNAAPLHPLLPSWPETKRAWQELEAGKYDWAQQAMKHWPDRVKEACKTNKSFAIAHGLA